MKNKKFLPIFLAICFALSMFCFVGIRANDTADAATGNTVEIYAINDFHGAVDKMPQIGGFLAAKKSEGAVVVNSGDMFQGSMESNSNFGQLLAECMDEAGFDSFTYGNHEFDWGLDNLRQLASNSNVPYLGANIYNWDANTRAWGEFADDLSDEYQIVDTPNGLRVGIIGIIGKDQITSISSQLVQTIGFKDPSEIVPDLSDKLRNQLNCDVVIVSAHTGQDTFLENKSWDITQYADAVLCAHTHRSEKDSKNGVPFIQGGSYGNYVTHVQLKVSNGNVTCNTFENIAYGSLSDVDTTVKAKIQTKIDNSNATISEQANQALATLSGGYLNSQTAVPRLVCNAVAEYATSLGYEIELVMVNNARNTLQAGEITYSELYEAIPFDNVVYVVQVSGKDIINEARYDSNSIWRVSGRAIANNSGQYYTIAVIDYLLYHQNSNRQYNYFASAFPGKGEPIALTKEGEVIYNYRLITRDFLLAKGTINASDYVDDNVHTDKSQLTKRVNLPVYGSTEPAPTGLSNTAIALIAVGSSLVVIAVVVVVVIFAIRAKRAKTSKASDEQQ